MSELGAETLEMGGPGKSKESKQSSSPPPPERYSRSRNPKVPLRTERTRLFLMVLYHAADGLQLLQDEVHLLLRGQRGQGGVVAPAGQLGVVVRVVGGDELQAGVPHQVPAVTAHVFWEGRKEGGDKTVSGALAPPPGAGRQKPRPSPSHLGGRCTPGCEVPTGSSGPRRSSCSWFSCCTRTTGCPWGKSHTPPRPPGRPRRPPSGATLKNPDHPRLE